MIRALKYLLFLLPLLPLACAAAETTTSISSFPWMKSVLPTRNSPAATNGISAITIDSDVYAATPSLFADLRLISPQKTEIPFMLERLTAVTLTHNRTTVNAKVKTLAKADNRLILELELPDGVSSPISGLQFDTPLRNFEKNVSLEARHGADWETIVNNAVICDYHDFFPYRIDRLFFPPTSARLLRLTISNLTEDRASPFYTLIEKRGGANASETTVKSFRNRIDFKLTGLSFFAQQNQTEPVTTAYPVTLKTTAQRDTITEIILQSRCEPLSELTISTTSENYVRRVTIQIPASQPDQWQNISSGIISSCSLPNVRRICQKLALPETRSAQYRIRIENDSNPPLENIRVSAVGPVWQLITVGQLPADSRLYYGGSHASPPQYDTAAVLSGVSRSIPLNYQLSSQTANPDFSNAKPVDSSARLRLLFWGLLSIIVIVLGLSLWHFARHAPPSEN